MLTHNKLHVKVNFAGEESQPSSMVETCVHAGEREGRVIITGKIYNQECIKEVLLYVYMHTGTPSKNGSHSVIGLSKIYIICIFIYVLSSSLLCTSASGPYKARKVGPKRCGDEPDE
uniref:Uncharacterized protein n=1 Tax=Ixodes ricinus TaxID=34613 RepID=A0A6B0UML3_IXORI